MTSTHSRESSTTPCGAETASGVPPMPIPQSLPSKLTAAPKHWRAARWISAIRDRAQRFAFLSETDVQQTSAALRGRVSQEGPDLPAVQIEASALMREVLRRACGVELYDEQLLAALILASGHVAEMQTGEGKTLACAPAAYLHGLTGRGVHIATPNAYLAQRDFDLLLPAYRMLGVSVSLLPERASAERKRAAYLCDVTYGTGYEFGFDYLRDQLSLRQMAGRRLGQMLWTRVCGGDASLSAAMQRPLYFAVVDEIDNVLLDDAGSPLVLSGSADAQASDASAHQLAHSLAARLVSGQHYRFDPSTGGVRLTDAGIDHIHAAEVAVPVAVLLRTWTEYVEKALLATVHFRRDVHYVVIDDAVQIVDASTGRIFSDRTWQDGLHQAIEAKEGVPITAEKSAEAQITRQRYFRLYERLCGMTGTAAGCEREFRQVYGLKTQSVPLRVPCQRRILLPRFFAHATAKWQAVAESVVAMHALQRPVLIGTRSIDDSERLADVFRRHALAFELLNGRQDAAEAAIVARAGQPGAITIATNLAGRGTDIQLAPDIGLRGGLHVVIAECHDSRRVDRQLIGRCARQGDPGSAQTFVSADDSLIQRFGPWLCEFMRRHGGHGGEVPVDLTRQVRRLQALAERQDYAARCALLRRDLSRDVLFSRPAAQP
jgi:preprotein translocase subunit SecA